MAYSCVDDGGVISAQEVLLVPQGGGAPTLLVGPPPSTPGTHTIRVLCVDAVGGEGSAQATYTVSVRTIFEAAVRDVQDETPVVGACAVLRAAQDDRSCDAASGPDADGAADGMIRWVQPLPGQQQLIVESVPQPPAGGRFRPLDRAVTIPANETTRVDLWTYRCASTCLWVQPRLGDGTEPGFPLWPLGVPGDFVEPVPHVPQGAAAPPPFPTAFVIPNLAPGATTDIPVVADDFGRAPLEVGRIRVSPTAGLNRLDPLVILPAHTVAVNLQNPDGTPADQGGLCLQLRGISPQRAARALCAPAGATRLIWRALPRLVRGRAAGGAGPARRPAGAGAAGQRPRHADHARGEPRLPLRPRGHGARERGQLPASADGRCRRCFRPRARSGSTSSRAAPSRPRPRPRRASPAVRRHRRRSSARRRGDYVVTRTFQFSMPPLTTGSNLVTVGPGGDATTDLRSSCRRSIARQRSTTPRRSAAARRP